MHRSFLTVLAAASYLAVAVAPGLGQARGAPESFADLAAQLSPSVVNISTTQTMEADSDERQQMPFPPGSPFEEFFKEFMERNRQGRPRRATSLGSGFIVDKSGLVVTNNHVINEADEITVRLRDGARYDAVVVGRDTKTDLAVLRIKADVEFPALSWGDSGKARVGDWVLAIGNPFGFGGSVTAGIISARGRDINAGPYDDFIQTDAAINRGNSGGPLFNLAGEVIGINTAIISPTGGSVGIGFAVPSALARTVVEQLVEFGRPRRGWLGVRIQTVTEEIAEGLGLDKPSGALVAGVSDEGPAKDAGIEAGDVILSFNGQDVREMRALPRIVAETPIGRTVAVEVWRKGARKSIEVKIAELDESAAQVAAVEEAMPKASEKLETLGMKLSTITPELKQQFELADDVAGVLVTDVDSDSSAAEKGIRPGDVIVEVQQDGVTTPQQVLDKIVEVQNENKRSVLLLLQRTGEKRFVAVRLKKS